MFTEEHEMSLQSKVSVARPNSKSLRATIPEGIVAFLELKKGDELEWKMEFVEGKRIVVVQKVNSDEDGMKIASKYIKQRSG
jgi:hypothetical protein